MAEHAGDFVDDGQAQAQAAVLLALADIAAFELLKDLAELVFGDADAGVGDDDFQRMREEVNKLSGADAALVVQLAEKLFRQRCKDLRVATYYLWARVQGEGEKGLADGLSLLAALLERYAEGVLPLRPNSRRQALEWLSSGKVLDCLLRFPEVVKAEAERTVAALAWLEHGLQLWPQEQRPQLEGLHAALSARLTRAGGVDALVPQHSARASPQAQRPGDCKADFDRFMAAPTSCCNAVRSAPNAGAGCAPARIAGWSRCSPPAWR